MELAAALSLVFLAGLALLWLPRRRRAARLEYVRAYAFPKGLDARFLKRREGLAPEQVRMVHDGLRQYFKLVLAAERKMVAMPSQAVDDLWHEFILYTRNYQGFCDRAFGRYLHHTPADAMRGPRTHNDALRRAWRLACKLEGINPGKPHRLPLLFAIDGLLGIADGFHYVPDCKGSSGERGSGAHCGADLGSGDSSGMDGTDGGNEGSTWFGRSHDATGDGGAHGGGDGGGSDGGGGCGGGCGGGD